MKCNKVFCKSRCAICGILVLVAVSLVSITVYAHKMNTATETETQVIIHSDEQVDGTDRGSGTTYIDVNALDQ